ncbi:MAG: histidine phosphatase family protein [Alphaproteobacteria bacterium]|nr:MAG: histidine phosphatase family protein [Alphaproteobacteria bacterium]
MLDAPEPGTGLLNGGSCMVTLYLLRHAKSDWDDMSLPDHDRPLAPRGERAATLMGRRMNALGISPGRIICSTAVRTRETLALVTAAAGFDVPAEFDDALYGAGVGTITDIARAGGDDLDSLLLIGHNPGFQDTALALSGHGDRDDLQRLRFKLPTGSLIAIEFDGVPLSGIKPGAGRLARFERPADLA